MPSTLSLPNQLAQLLEHCDKHHVRGVITIQRSTLPSWFEPLASLFSTAMMVSDDDALPLKKVTHKQLKHALGSDLDFLLLDFRDGINANALGIASGLVKGGGILVLWLSEQFPHTPFELHLAASLQRAFSTLSVVGDDMASTPLANLSGYTRYQDALGCGSHCQSIAVEAIQRVVTGHSKRPLVMTADRGRGKSTALGIAAAELMQSGKRHILVTAPSFSAVSSLFETVAQRLSLPDSKQLEYRQSVLTFIAPDLVVETLPDADMVVVDEAAAMPIPMLLTMAKQYRRMVFSTTTHGYEGSGQGFELKFVPALKAIYPESKRITLSSPIRWSAGCPLEAWLFDALLLDAESSKPVDDGTALSYHKLDSQTLLESPRLLRDLFGLLIVAHYQTSPSDLQQLLDDESTAVWVASKDDVIGGVALVSEEGQFDLSLAQKVIIGERRVKGHLLAQSVATHCADPHVLTLGAVRIMRVAVAGSLRRQGVGLGLINAVRSAYPQHYLGTSFGCSGETLPFWLAAQFLPLRLGVSRDAASGTYSLLMVSASDSLPPWLQLASERFLPTFERQCLEQFQRLPLDVVVPLFTSALKEQAQSKSDTQLLLAYSRGGLGYDLIVDVLSRWVKQQLVNREAIFDPSFQRLLRKCLLNHSWETLLSDRDLLSRKMVEKQWRALIDTQLSRE
ncbi:GNAT family N-acetyltransferase [Thaumasiovibrio subtropicus]|uniref:GNAT family N-acetyltransferase n=1 Tax=Thaumasiovibrio subtropicus TaxID=1891207 RepID=UPI00131C2D03|nr:GNAT family N-acetyltransferase [Thaumasiovibrio subtropicus]